MRRRLLTGVLLLLPMAGARAQDERRVSSPNGQIEFRVFVAQPQAGGLSRLAYQLLLRGRPIIDTSFLGLDIHEQEPLLGENVGLIASHTVDAGGSFRSLIAEYMQNGSIGRRINLEVRVWDEGVAFRYVVPRSTALDEIPIEDEATEFDLARDSRKPGVDLPWAIARPGVGWIGIAEVRDPDFPRMSLIPGEDGVPTAHLARSGADSQVAFAGRTPLICPWRVVTIARDREHVFSLPTPLPATR